MKLLTVFLTVSCFAVNASMAKNLTQMVETTGEILVKFKQSQKKDFLNQKSADYEIRKDLKLLSGEYALLKINKNSSMIDELALLNANSNIEYAEPNYLYKVIKNKQSSLERLLNADPKFSDLWGLNNTGHNEPRSRGQNSSPQGRVGADINALSAWGITKGDSVIKIAVIDTGVDYNHEDLRNNIWTNTAEANGIAGVDDDGNGYIDDIHGYDFANKDGDPMDGNGHGTHCAGTIAAEHNNVGVAGVMANAQIVGVKFLTDQGSGSTIDAIEAIDYATKVGVDIMSNSWGGGGFSKALYDSIEAAKNAGIVFTAAAGNSASNNDQTPQYPANYELENIISVAAHNYNDGLASFSCYGANTVHVAAPGRNILSTTPGDKYEVLSGTSMATPHVSGVIGLYLSKHGSTDLNALRDMLMNTSVYGAAYGRTVIAGGRVDAYNFLTHTLTSRPAKPDPNQWQDQRVQVFESDHPYSNSEKVSQTYTIPGAKYIRVKIKKIDIEEKYDSLKVIDSYGGVIQTLDGQGGNIVSDYVEGDTLRVEFNSDSSINGWGYLIEEVQFIQ